MCGVVGLASRKKGRHVSEMLPDDAAQKITDLIFSGQKIQAIKLCRPHTGQGLKEAKEFIESMRPNCARRSRRSSRRRRAERGAWV